MAAMRLKRPLESSWNRGKLTRAVEMMDISIEKEPQMKAQVAQVSLIPNRSCNRE